MQALLARAFEDEDIQQACAEDAEDTRRGIIFLLQSKRAAAKRPFL
jgi:hypothetical protein